MTSLVPLRLVHLTFEPEEGADSNLPPIIFLHGTTSTKECWGEIPQHIADKSRRKVYSVDTRNHGDSEWDDNILSYETNVIDLLHFMDTHQIPKAVLIGHSIGGATCMQTAFMQPERLEMAFVLDMFTKPLPKHFVEAFITIVQIFEDAAKSLSLGCSEEKAQSQVLQYASSSKAFEDAILTVFVRSSSKGQNSSAQKAKKARKTSENKLKANPSIPLKRNKDGSYSLNFNTEVVKKASNNFHETLPELEGFYDGPVYFLYGADSPYEVYKDSDRIRKLFPNARMVEIEGAGHNVHFDQPEQLSRKILNRLLF